MGLALLGVLIGLNIASTIALAWFAARADKAFVAVKNSVDERLAVLESRKVHVPSEPGAEQKKVRAAGSMTQLRRELEQESMEKR